MSEFWIPDIKPTLWPCAKNWDAVADSSFSFFPFFPARFPPKQELESQINSASGQATPFPYFFPEICLLNFEEETRIFWGLGGGKTCVFSLRPQLYMAYVRSPSPNIRALKPPPPREWIGKAASPSKCTRRRRVGACRWIPHRSNLLFTVIVWFFFSLPNAIYLFAIKNFVIWSIHKGKKFGQYHSPKVSEQKHLLARVWISWERRRDEQWIGEEGGS